MSDRFREHRAVLEKTVGDQGIAIVPASVEAVRNNDVHHEFRQDSDFYYLTGFDEPDAVCVITPNHPDGTFHLFVNPRDREIEIWTGYRQGVEGALQHHQADAAYPLDQLDTVLARLMVGRDALYYRPGDSSHDDRITRLLGRARGLRNRFGLTMPSTIVDLAPVLGEQRLRKNPAEIESLAAACELSAEGHREAMRFALPGMYEYQIQAAMEFVWREGGSPRNGYPSIVASGPNAIVLHYVENDRLVEDGDLVLIDAAAEIDLYSSDITRTFPANGKFTAAQRAVYDVVLSAQRQAIRVSQPGATVLDPHETAKRVLTEGLVDLGLLPVGVDDALAMHLYREFFMHGTSHWLGMDVHDTGAMRVDRKPRILEPGMCFTVEPGLYVAADRPEVEFTLHRYDTDAWMERRMREGVAAARAAEEREKEDAPTVVHTIPPEFLGIGIRIEDDILITTDGHTNLSALAPTDPDKIEQLCAEGSWLHRA